MGNKATPPRSFNTIRHSQTKERAQRQRTQRVVLLSIFVILGAMVLSLLVLGALSIANAIIDNLPEETTTEAPNETNDPAQILYQQITKTSADINSGVLLMVNQNLEYHFPSISLIKIYDQRSKFNGTNVYQLASTDYKLQADAFDAFDAMMLKYYELTEDNSIKVSSAYRTLDDQANLPGTDIEPGHSDHHTGYCVALKYNDGTDLEPSHWIFENCHKYGFVIRYPENKSDKTGVSEYTHCLRYVGVAHATYMQKNNLCLEEYVELLKNSYSSGNHLTVSALDGNSYEIYYVPASTGDLTTFNVPSNYKYTVSGDNHNGFIVTVNLSAPNA